MERNPQKQEQSFKMRDVWSVTIGYPILYIDRPAKNCFPFKNPWPPPYPWEVNFFSVSCQVAILLYAYIICLQCLFEGQMRFDKCILSTKSRVGQIGAVVIVSTFLFFLGKTTLRLLSRMPWGMRVLWRRVCTYAHVVYSIRGSNARY